MNLISIESLPDHASLLYDLLAEREDEVNISHKEMPTWEQHLDFIRSKPYQEWSFIIERQPVGVCYLTWDDEIGVFVFKKFQGHGYGKQAVRLLMKKHGPRRYLANINPRNSRSIAMFEQLGFKLIQQTYEANA